MSDQPNLVQFPMNTENAMKVFNWTQKYEATIDQDRINGNRDRIYDNFSIYSGVNKGQWDAQAIEQLREQQRPAHQFNLVLPAIEDKLGQLNDSPLQSKFLSSEPEKQDDVDLLQKLYDNDYAAGNWETKQTEFERDGLIHTGIKQMYINYERDPLGNVDVRARNPTQTYFDQNWQTDDIKDCRQAFTSIWLTPAQIKEQFHTKSEEVDNAILLTQFSTNDESTNVNQQWDRSAQWYDRIRDQYKVVESTWMERETVRKVFDAQGTEQKEFSQVLYQRMSIEALHEILKNQGAGYRIDEEEMDVCKVFAFCPGLSNHLVLAEGFYPLQLGRLPFVVWSYQNVYGQRQGLVDLIKDPQEVLNKRQSQITHSLGTAGLNNYTVESDTFTSPAEIANFRQNQAKGGQTFEVEPGSNKENKIKIQERPGIPHDLLQASQAPEAMITKIAGLGSTSRTGQAKSGTSGALFDSQTEASNQSLVMQLQSLKKQRQIEAEMYYYAAKQVYSGAPRTIKDNRNNTEIELNRMGVSPEGEIKVRNNIADLPRHDVIISDSPAGRTHKQENLQKYVELQRVTTNPIMKSLYEKHMIDSLGLPSDAAEEMKQAAEAWTAFQFKQVESQGAQMDMATAQAAQAMNPQGQAGGQPPQGPREIASGPGAGPIPSNAGIAGGEGQGNNASSNNSPSDVTG